MRGGRRGKGSWKVSLVVVVLQMIAAASAAQTTRGGIQGTVFDEARRPLPGVTVSISSPALMGTRTTVTDVRGGLRFSLLPPGTYRVVFNLPGFMRLEQEGIIVSLGTTITLDVTLRAAFTDEVLVTPEAPVLDVTSTTVGVNLGRDLLTDLPTGRTFASLTFLAAGAVSGGQGDNANIMGATGSENRYVVDELDTTDPAFGTIGTRLSFNFIQEVQVQTGGYEPEYGGALGGVVNMITKSGSNQLHGEVFAYYTDDSFSTEAKVPVGRAETVTSYTDYDVGFDLGGKIVRDRLWYFVAYNPNVRDETIQNDVFRLSDDGIDLVQSNVMRPETRASYYAAKLTWQVDRRSSVTGTVFGDPTSIDHAYSGSFFVDTPYVPTDRTYAKWDEGGTNWGVTWSSILNEDMLLEAKVGHMETRKEFAPSLDIPAWYDWTGTYTEHVGQGVAFGGPGFQALRDTRQRDQARLAFTWFLGDDHEIKAGAQWSWVRYDVSYHSTGPSAPFCAPLSPDAYLWDSINGQDLDFSDATDAQLAALGYALCDPGNGDPEGGLQQPARIGSSFDLKNGYYLHRGYANDSDGETDETAVYLQDAWKVTDYLTVDAGVRADAPKATGDLSRVNESQDLELGFHDQVQPRVGLIWDFAHNGRSKLFAHYGTFYESIPLDINVRAFGNETFDFYSYSYPEDGSLPTVNNPTLGTPDNTGELFSVFHAGGGTRVDPGIRGQYTEEYVSGAEYEVMTDLAVGLQGIYRRLGRVIEDVSADGGATYFITNPGGCLDANPVTGAELDEPACFPHPARIYRALLLKLNKRYSNGWQLYASLLWSRNQGNYGGLFRAEDAQHDPNITSAFDVPQQLVGAYGPLPNDHRWQLRSYGSYRWGSGLVTGFNFSWLTGAPVTQFGFDADYGAFQRFVTPRGTYGRTPSVKRLDLHLSYPLEAGGRDLEIVVDVFNLLNQQKALAVDELWTTLDQRNLDPNDEQWSGDTTNTLTGLPYDANGDGAIDVAEQRDNPTFGAATSYQPPRSYRVGLRFSW